MTLLMMVISPPVQSYKNLDFSTQIPEINEIRCTDLIDVDQEFPIVLLVKEPDLHLNSLVEPSMVVNIVPRM